MWGKVSIKSTLVVVFAMTVSGWASVTSQLANMASDGRWHDVVRSGEQWLESHSSSDPSHGCVWVQVADASVGAAREARDAEALRTLRARYHERADECGGATCPLPGCVADVLSRAYEVEAQVVLVTIRSDDFNGLRRFRTEYAGTGAAGIAFDQEAQLAFGIVANANTVEAWREFWQTYSAAPGAAELVENARRREVAVAHEGLVHDQSLAGYRHFRTTYAGWPEADHLMDEVFEAEAELALARATLEAGPTGLEPLEDFKAEYDRPEWVERANRAIARVLLEPLTHALDMGYPLDHDVVDTILQHAGGHPHMRQEAGFADRIHAMATSYQNPPMLRLLHGLYPDDPRRADIEPQLYAALVAEAEQWDSAATPAEWKGGELAWRRVLTHFPAGDHADHAEQRFLWHRELSNAGRRGYEARIARIRSVGRGEVELTVEVFDCHGRRVIGLGEEAFSVFADSQAAEITDFRGMEHDRPIDLVFALDMSGSMETEREAVRQAIEHFAATFDFRARDAQLGLVTFSEELLDDHSPRRGTGRFLDWMATLPSNVGGGGGEDGVAALLRAADLADRRGAEHVAVMLTDEPLQANETGRGRVGTRGDPCTRMQRVSECLSGCGWNDERCATRCLNRLGREYRSAIERCQNQAGDACQQLSSALQAGLASCAQPVYPRSELYDALVAELEEHALRPFILSGTQSDAWGLASLAADLDGRLIAVPDDTTSPEPYIAALESIAEQLAGQYFIRYRGVAPSGASGGAAGAPTVLVRPSYRWRTTAQLPAPHIVALQHLSGTPDCPRLLALGSDGTVHRSSSCGTTWRADAAAIPASVVAATSHGEHTVALTLRGELWAIRADATGPELLGDALPRIAEVAYSAGGRLWAVSGPGAGGGVEVFSWGFAGELDAVWPSDSAQARLLAVADDAACLGTTGGERRCRSLSDADWRADEHAGLSAGWSERSSSVYSLGTDRSAVNLLTDDSGDVYRSIDLGASWTRVLEGDSRRRFESLQGEWAVVCATSSRDVHCSEDEGRTWFPIGLPFLEEGEAALVSLEQTLALAQSGTLQRVQRLGNRELPAANVFFDTDSFEPQARMLRFLDETADLLAEDETLRLRIEGHADRRGTDAHNDELSLNRANRVHELLVERGVDPGRLEVLAFGEHRPVRRGNSSADLARNRRVEFLMLREVPATGWFESDCFDPAH